MSEETNNPTQPNENDTTKEVPAQEKSLTEGLNSEAEGKEDTANAGFKAPEGIDEALFDKEKGVLKADAVKEALTKAAEEKDNALKQALDMRKKLSKGAVVPDKVEDYGADYKPEDKFAGFYSEEQKETPEGMFARSACGEIDKMAFENGFTKQQSDAVKNQFNKLMEELHVFKTKTPEEVSAEKEAWVSEQKKMLGENADEIIKANVKHYQNNNMFSEGEKKVIISLIGQGYEGVSIFNKVRKLISGTAVGDDIPVSSSANNGLADDITLMREYKDPKTTDARKMQILQQRKDAGRGKFASNL